MSNEISGLAAPGKLKLFGKFSLDPEKKVLWRLGKPVGMPLKAVEILCVLVTQPGAVVTKDEILTSVWPDTFVEESNLTNNISLLRKTFKELGEPGLIETIPGRGYRFVGEVQDIYERDEITIERRSVTQTVIGEKETVLPVSQAKPLLPPAPRRVSRPLMVSLAAVALVTIAGLFYWQYNSRPRRVTPADITSLAVLPLRSFDGDVDDNLRLRMMDSMVTNLGNIESLSVRPTSSTMRFLGSGEDAVDIGRRLMVDAVLEGSVHRENNTIRVTVQLVSVSSGDQIWSGQFDGQADRLLDLQNLVSAKLSGALGPRLSVDGRPLSARQPTTSAEAYEEYLKGRYFWNKRTPDSLRSAISAFENAVKLDPAFALAHVGLADVYCVLPEYSDENEKGSYGQARAHATRALELDASLAEAYASLAFVEFWLDKDLAASKALFERSIAVNPNYATAHHWFANVLLANNDVPAAVGQMTAAQKLDPLSLVINTELGILHYYSRQYAPAEAQFRHTLEIESGFHRAAIWLGRVLTMNGQYAEALALYARLPPDVAQRDGTVAEVGYTKARSGDIAGALMHLQDMAARPAADKTSFSSAIICLGIPDNGKAIGFLGKAAVERESDLAYLQIDPIFDPLRADPQFDKLSERYR